MTQPNRLDPADLEALIVQTGDQLGIDARFIEKDYWVVAVIRSLSTPVAGVTPVLKGGTSLSKAWRLTQRFSEDVDISLVLPDTPMSVGARDRALKQAAARVAAALELTEGKGPGTWGLEQTQAKRGNYRNVRFRFEELLPLPGAGPSPISQGAQLEMAIHDLGDLHWETATIEPFVAATARELDPNFTSPDLNPVVMPVLRRERTLFEKIAHVHQVVSRYPEGDTERRLRQIGRHYYDIHSLLGDEMTLRSLREPGAAIRLTEEADALSQKAGFPYVPRPAGGFANSPAFDPDHPAMAIVRPSYETALRLVFGDAGGLDDCLGRVHEHADLL
ncbi:MAG: nucleotidyl transferase AbiEii/AbiGii toxin family protein [Chloroflexota bacterium]